MSMNGTFQPTRSHVIYDFGLVLGGGYAYSGGMCIESAPNRNSPPEPLMSGLRRLVSTHVKVGHFSEADMNISVPLALMNER